MVDLIRKDSTKGRTDGGVAPEGYIGEVRNQLQGSAPAVNTSYITIATDTLPVGTWLVAGHLYTDAFSGHTTNTLTARMTINGIVTELLIRSTSSTTATDHNDQTPAFWVAVTSPITVSFEAKGTFTSLNASWKANSGIKSVRIA